ncbi:MAG: ABC transporter ATP-binding protein [Rhizobiaceae bacterium]|nr:ABC transporter ATP-binding protein [Rhizobiaceae bacterium]MCV0408138.1 ABC transporter ATP-binding protein [Rhizobiaceae bacterium]
MAHIALRDAAVDFPIYDGVSRSLRSRVMALTTGGTIDRRADGHVVVRGLDGISLDITHGERVGLIGHNGSGKTTLLRVLSGIYEPSHGTAVIDGQVVSLINIALGINPEYTGRENIRYRAAIMGLTMAELDERFDEIAEFSGLGGFLDMPFRTYSTGMQMRLAFAVSTSIQPEILIMDEWLSTGDEDFKRKAGPRLKKVVDDSSILVIASHSKALIEANCNRVIWLEHGKIKADGGVDEVTKEYFGKAGAPG